MSRLRLYKMNILVYEYKTALLHILNGCFNKRNKDEISFVQWSVTRETWMNIILGDTFALTKMLRNHVMLDYNTYTDSNGD